MEPNLAPQAPVDAEQLAVAHLPLVHHLVREISGRIPSYVDRSDLTSAGYVALVRAAQAFEPERGVAFGSYAAVRIRGALVDELRSVDWASRSVRRRGREIEQERARLTASTGAVVKDEAVAASLGLTTADVTRSDADLARASVTSLQADGEVHLGALACTMASPDETVDRGESLRYLAAAIEELPERLRTVVRGYFIEERPMTELAVELGVSESRVSQLRAEALEPATTSAPQPAGVAARRREAYVQAVFTRASARPDTRAAYAVAV
jgi:RNA polymerase sigma factor FliA